jgi:formyltetrahydrofolate deformylase
MQDVPLHQSATLLVACPDRKGLVAALGQLLYGHGVNILDASQHTDLGAGQFFQRIHMDLRELHTDRIALEGAIAEVAERLSMRWELRYQDRLRRVALMVSKYDHCLQDLLWRYRAGELHCELPLIVSNHPDLEHVATAYKVPFFVFPISADTRQAQERAMLDLFARERVDLIVLARYMQVLGAQFCETYSERIINIHHSFLPAFVGGKPYHQAYERGVKIIGATAHYVTRDLDQGPIIEQDVARVSHRDTVDDMVRKGRDLERLVLARAVRAQLENRVLVYRNKTVVFE